MQHLVAKEIFQNWEYNWFGVWVKHESDDERFPVMNDLIDPNWSFSEKPLLIKYLRSAPIVISTLLKPTHCSRCDKKLGDPGCWLTDNVWLWHNCLAHYVEKHSIRLPDRMVKHIVTNEFKPPSKITVPFKDLPWPPDFKHRFPRSGQPSVFRIG